MDETTDNQFQNNSKNKLVDPSPNVLKPAGFTSALHKGHVLSLSNLKKKKHDIISRES